MDVLFIILLDLALVILHLLGFLTCHYVTVLFSVRFDTSILSGMSLVRAHLGTFGGLDDNGMMLGWLVFDFGMVAWLPELYRQQVRGHTILQIWIASCLHAG